MYVYFDEATFTNRQCYEVLTKCSYICVCVVFQVRQALSASAKKDGIADTPDSMFAYLIERVRNNLHIVLCMSPVGDPFR